MDNKTTFGSKKITILEIDKETRSWISRYSFEENILDEEFDYIKKKFRKNGGYVFSYSLIRRFLEYNKIDVISQKNNYLFREFHILDNLSYFCHTNRELHMMINEQKPISVFSMKEGDSHDIFGGQKFSSMAKKYKIKKIVHKFSNEYILIIFFLPKEEWRVKSYIELKKTTMIFGSCRQLEWLEGTLLGYTDSENMEFLQSIYKETR